MDLCRNETPIFTVIIPTFNRGNLIVSAINSVLNQTFEDFELIVVDDGSEDNTREVVDDIVDPRLRYIFKENGGQNSALNVGIKSARGEYIAFLDSDDIWLPNKLKMVYLKYQSDPELSVVYHTTGIKTKSGEIEKVNNDYLEGYIYKEVLQQEFMSSQISLSCKRVCLEEIGFYDEEFVMFQDDDMCFQLAQKYKVGLIREPLSVIGGKAQNRLTSDNNRVILDYERLIEKYKTDILQWCGNQKLADMYYKLSIYYGRTKDIKTAKVIFSLAKVYDVDKRYYMLKWIISIFLTKMQKSFITMKRKLLK